MEGRFVTQESVLGKVVRTGCPERKKVVLYQKQLVVLQSMVKLFLSIVLKWIVALTIPAPSMFLSFGIDHEEPTMMNQCESLLRVTSNKCDQARSTSTRPVKSPHVGHGYQPHEERPLCVVRPCIDIPK